MRTTAGSRDDRHRPHRSPNLRRRAVPAAGDIAPTTRIVVPMPEGSYIKTSPFGMREDPKKPGLYRMHYGTDFAAPDGHSHPRRHPPTGWCCGPDTGKGGTTSSSSNTTSPAPGSTPCTCTCGTTATTSPQVIGCAPDSTSPTSAPRDSTGPHLHFEVHPGAWTSPAVDPDAWLANTTPKASPTPGPVCAGAHHDPATTRGPHPWGGDPSRSRRMCIRTSAPSPGGWGSCS